MDWINNAGKLAGSISAVIALLALVLDASYWWVAAAIQAESLLKGPLCWYRIRRGRWIHDVTLPEGHGL